MSTNTFLTILVTAGSLVVGWSAVNIQPNNGQSYTDVLLNGSTSEKYDIVFIGDGFTATEQNDFNMRVESAVKALTNTVPYSNRMCAFNIWRVNVVSRDSGIDRPADGISKSTELDCRFADPSRGEPDRWILTEAPLKCLEAANHAPDHQAIVILVNSSRWGGCADGQFVFCSLHQLVDRLITHELGHHIGGLADEYFCNRCDGTESAERYTGDEPQAANVTTETAWDMIKWNAFIPAGTTLPTEENQLDDTPIVGAWEGAGHYALGVFRPQSHCHMREPNWPLFCAVCTQRLSQTLESFCPP